MAKNKRQKQKKIIAKVQKSGSSVDDKKNAKDEDEKVKNINNTNDSDNVCNVEETYYSNEEEDDDDGGNESDESDVGDDDDDANDNENDFINIARYMPAFVKSSNNNTAKNNQAGKESLGEMSNSSNTMIPNDNDNFTYVKKGTKQAPMNIYKTSEGYGKQALFAMKINHFSQALRCLDHGITLDSSELRHYLNRSYCYLRTGDYERALKDAKFISEHSIDTVERIQAKRREGQAYRGLQNYEASEQAFRECIELMPECLYTKRELKRLQIVELVNMGFNERDAILVLEKTPNTVEALMVLTENVANNNECDVAESAIDDEIFYSDDESRPSNEKLLSALLNNDSSIPDRPEFVEPYPVNEATNDARRPSRPASKDRELRIKRTINPPVKTPSVPVNDMAIWLGNVTYEITENMIKERFEKFGKVSLIWRSMQSNYAFVNFRSAATVKKIFDEASTNNGHIDVGGYALPVKPAEKRNKCFS